MADKYLFSETTRICRSVCKEHWKSEPQNCYLTKRKSTEPDNTKPITVREVVINCPKAAEYYNRTYFAKQQPL